MEKREIFVTILGIIFIIFTYSLIILEAKFESNIIPIRVEYGLFAITAAIGVFGILYSALIGTPPAIFFVVGLLVILDFLALILSRTAPTSVIVNLGK